MSGSSIEIWPDRKAYFFGRCLERENVPESKRVWAFPGSFWDGVRVSGEGLCWEPLSVSSGPDGTSWYHVAVPAWARVVLYGSLGVLIFGLHEESSFQQGGSKKCHAVLCLVCCAVCSFLFKCFAV